VRREGGILWLVEGVVAPSLRFPSGVLLVIGGPSGAGKSTLAARVLGSEAVFDPDAVRAELAATRGTGVEEVPWPEALTRTRARYDERLATGDGAVVVTTAVRRGHRHGLARDARVHGTSCHLLMLDAGIELCRAGRAAQGTPRISEGLFEHLVREWLAFRRALSDRADPEGVAERFGSVTVLDRPAVDALQRVQLG
jgi:predicted kinase